MYLVQFKTTFRLSPQISNLSDWLSTLCLATDQIRCACPMAHTFFAISDLVSIALTGSVELQVSLYRPIGVWHHSPARGIHTALCRFHSMMMSYADQDTIPVSYSMTK